MNDDRWKYLMSLEGEDDTLTENECKEGWHFCWDFDGLLVGPGMGEQQFCHCFDNPEQKSIA